jgi:hypothetical protein
VFKTAAVSITGWQLLSCHLVVVSSWVLAAKVKLKGLSPTEQYREGAE